MDGWFKNLCAAACQGNTAKAPVPSQFFFPVPEDTGEKQETWGKAMPEKANPVIFSVGNAHFPPNTF